MSIMDNTQTAPATDTKFTLDQNQRLSASLLWQLQRNYFEQQGIEAWRQGSVPHYITSNPFIAEAYARVVFAFLRDWRNATQTNRLAPALDRRQPVYIIELGAGPGRFGFHFLKQWQLLLDRSDLRDIQIKYILTDFVERNIDYWRDHPSLQPLVEAGLLDFACFDAEQCRPFELICSGETLTAQTIRNPLIVVANYFFDAIPQDVFYVHQGQLHEGRVTVTAPQPEVDLSDPELLARLEVVFEHLPVHADIYDDALFNQILHEYSQRLAETTILFPIAALRCIRFLLELSSARLFLLSADKGFHWEEDLLSWGEPVMAIHGGCFSMTLNYHALEQYVLKQGGHCLHTSRHHTSLDVVALLPGAPDDFSETAQAFEQAIEKFSPHDLFNLLQSIEQKLSNLSLEQMLAWLRLTRWDANLLLNFFPALLEQVAAAPEALKEELHWVIQHVWDNYYDIGEEQYLAFYLGTLLCGMGLYPEALNHLEYSLQHFGPDARTLYNISLCHFALLQLDNALECVKQSLAIDPSCEPAKVLRIKIESTLGRQVLRARNAGGATSTVG